MSFDPSKAPLVSETLLKRRRSLDDLAYKRSVTVGKQKKRKRAIRGEDVKIKRPEQFLRESRIKDGSKKKMERKKRKADLMKTAGVDIQSTVGFAVRIHEARHSSEDVKLALRTLGLNKKYEGVFVKLDEPGLAHLKSLDSYVAYGYISQKSVVELVHRRAFTVTGGTKKALKDNLAVEQELGDKGIICLQDLSHEVYTVGENFEEANGMICPFKLSAPTGGYEKKVLNRHDQVEAQAGFLGGKMDEFLDKIL